MKQFNNFKMIRNTFSILFCLVIYSTNAQIEPLLEHNWELEKVIIDDEEIMAEPDYNSSDDVWAKIYFEENYFYFVDLVPDISFDDENSSFSIDELMFNFGSWHNSEAYITFRNQFIIADDDLVTAHNPYTYSFREEGEILYLDITNNEGSVATFWTSTLSNTNFEEIEFSFYPNPVKDRLHIESAQATIQQLEIVDVNGKQVLSTDFNNESIDVSHLSKGVYFVKITTKEGSTTKKFVKE